MAWARGSPCIQWLLLLASAACCCCLLLSTTLALSLRTHPLKCFRAFCDRSLVRSKGSHSCERPAQPPPARASRMASSASRLGPASRTSVARLRPAESDVRSMSSTRSKTVGAVRQVRGGAEAGFWVVCWVPRGGVRQLAAAGSGGGAAERGRGVLCRVSPWAGGVRRLF